MIEGRLDQWFSSQHLKLSADGAITASSGRLFQVATTGSEKEELPMLILNLDFRQFQSVALCFLAFSQFRLRVVDFRQFRSVAPLFPCLQPVQTKSC